VKRKSPLFTIGNHHVESCGTPPQIDGDVRKRYHGYFENDYGEQAIFVFDYEVQEGKLWMGDAGWEKPYLVRNGSVPGLVLNDNERTWLFACWKAATARLED
jgi:hypothetical protein